LQTILFGPHNSKIKGLTFNGYDPLAAHSHYTNQTQQQGTNKGPYREANSLVIQKYQKWQKETTTHNLDSSRPLFGNYLPQNSKSSSSGDFSVNGKVAGDQNSGKKPTSFNRKGFRPVAPPAEARNH